MFAVWTTNSITVPFFVNLEGINILKIPLDDIYFLTSIVSEVELLWADLHGTILSHAINLRHESFRVNQTYNLLTIVAYDTKNVVRF